MPLLLPKKIHLDPCFDLKVLDWPLTESGRGFVIRITNRDQAPRTYHFDIGVFKRFRPKHRDQRMVKTVYRLKPGHTSDILVALYDGQWLMRSYVEDMAVRDEYEQRIARYSPELNVFRHMPWWQLFKLHYVAGAALVLLVGRIGLHMLVR